MEPTPAIEYRVRRKFRNVGIACTLFAVAFGVFSTITAYFNVDGSFARPKLMALMFALGWSAFALLGIWLWRIYYKYKLIVDGRSLQQFGMWYSQRIEFSAVREIRWYIYPAGGSIRVVGPERAMNIEFGNFTWTDRKELISLLLKAILSERHVGLDKFHQHFTPTPDRVGRARLAKLVLLIFFVGNAAFFGWLGFVNRDMKHLIAAGLNFAGALYLARHILRHKGTSLSAQSDEVTGDRATDEAENEWNFKRLS
jgi:hypothetical protein